MSRRICITNNPSWGQEYSCTDFVDGSAWDVLVNARDLVHKGWRFLGHPLYGNFQPVRQPYRTLLMEAPETGQSDAVTVDMESFEMLETALEAFRDGFAQHGQGEILSRLPREQLNDFALLDRSLMEHTLRTYLV